MDIIRLLFEIINSLYKRPSIYLSHLFENLTQRIYPMIIVAIIITGVKGAIILAFSKIRSSNGLSTTVCSSANFMNEKRAPKIHATTAKEKTDVALFIPSAYAKTM